MQDLPSKNSKTAPGLPLLAVGGLISFSLFLLRYFHVLDSELEVILAPFIVITLLTYGDRLLLFILLSPVNMAYKLKRTPKPKHAVQQQELTLKQP